MFFKMKFIIPLAVILSALSTFAIFKYIQKQKEGIQNPKVSLSQVVVANTDLPIGNKISESDLKVSDWPENIVPKNSYSDISELIDRVIKIEVYEGEPILESKLAPIGSEGGFSSIIPQGMRALSVTVDTHTGVGGFILPNARVDVLVTVSSSSKKEESSTRIILEDVKVLAVDQTYDRKGDEPVLVQTVTLLVTPEEAEKLVLACTEGKLQLSLRNPADRSVKPTSGVKLKELVSKPRPRRVTRRSTPARSQTPPKEELEEKIVEIIRSSERSEIKVKGKKKSEKENES